MNALFAVILYTLRYQVVPQFPLLAWASGKLHSNCGTLRKHFTKPGKRPDGGQCKCQSNLELPKNYRLKLSTCKLRLMYL